VYCNSSSGDFEILALKVNVTFCKKKFKYRFIIFYLRAIHTCKHSPRKKRIKKSLYVYLINCKLSLLLKKIVFLMVSEIYGRYSWCQDL